MTKYARIGSVSHATMREEDLIPAFLEALDDCKESLSLDARGREAETVKRVAYLDNEMGDIERRMEADDYFGSEECTYDLEWLTDQLNDFAPPYCYFGANEGDGADYGFWICWDSVEESVRDGEIVKASAGDEWPALDDDCEYVLEVTDHGDATLYSRYNDSTPVWEVV